MRVVRLPRACPVTGLERGEASYYAAAAKLFGGLAETAACERGGAADSDGNARQVRFFDGLPNVRPEGGSTPSCGCISARRLERAEIHLRVCVPTIGAAVVLIQRGAAAALVAVSKRLLAAAAAALPLLFAVRRSGRLTRLAAGASALTVGACAGAAALVALCRRRADAHVGDAAAAAAAARRRRRRHPYSRPRLRRICGAERRRRVRSGEFESRVGASVGRRERRRLARAEVASHVGRRAARRLHGGAVKQALTEARAAAQSRSRRADTAAFFKDVVATAVPQAVRRLHGRLTPSTLAMAALAVPACFGAVIAVGMLPPRSLRRLADWAVASSVPRVHGDVLGFLRGGVGSKRNVKPQLAQTLAARGLEARDLGGRGDCMFLVLAEAFGRAKVDELGGGSLERRAQVLRAALVGFMREHADEPIHADGEHPELRAHVRETKGKDIEEYLDHPLTGMAHGSTQGRRGRFGTYGDDIVLLAAAWKYHIGIRIYSDVRDADPNGLHIFHYGKTASAPNASPR